MLAILDEENLSGVQLENKLKVIKILGKFLKESDVPTWDREINESGFSWLGWTVVNGNAHDIVALIESKQPYDPLLGKSLIIGCII